MKPIQLCKKSKFGCNLCTSQGFCKLSSMSDDELEILNYEEEQRVGNKRRYRINLSYKYYSDFLCDAVNNMQDNYPVYKDIKRQIEYVAKSIKDSVNLHLFSIKLIDLQNTSITVNSGEGYCFLSGVGVVECEFDNENNIPTFRVMGEMLTYFMFFLGGEQFSELIRCDIDLI